MQEQVIEARQNVKDSFAELAKNLKIYATSEVNYQKSKLQTVKNTALEKFKNVQISVNNGMKAARKGTLKFKAGVNQKAKSALAKIGEAKNAAMKKLKNLDQKIVHTLATVGVIATAGAVASVRMVNGIIDYSSDQIAQYRANRAERMRKRAEMRQQKAEIRRQNIEEFKRKITDPIAQIQANHYEKQQARIEAERIKAEEQERLEKERQKRAAEHQNAIESAKFLKEEMRRQDIEKIKNGILNIKNGAIQKARSAKSKICTVSKKVLEKLNPHNLDMKIANAFVNAQVMISNGLANTSNKMNSFIEYQKEQIAKYEQNKQEKAQAKAERLEQIKKEQEERKQELEAQKAEKARKREEAKAARKDQFETSVLQFKNGIIQKVQSGVGKLGSAKRAVVANVIIQKENIDNKINDIITGAKVAVAGTVGAGIIKYNQVKNYTTDQIQAIKNWNTMHKEEQRQKKAERDAQIAIEREQLIAKNQELRQKLEAEKARLQQEIDKIFKPQEAVVPTMSM